MRIVLILPCCMGDVVMATATLGALRRGYPAAHITWAVGRWSQPVIAHHPALDALLDTGEAALPVKSWRGFWRFVGQLRAGHYDLAVSLVRSPLMSLAVALSGIPQRAGLDSGGRGFGYTVRARIDPAQARPEGDIYLDTARALGLDTHACYAHIPPDPAAVASLRQRGLPARYLVVHPGGGQNPGMQMTSKRWPPAYFAMVANALAARASAVVVLIGAPDDAPLAASVQADLTVPALNWVGALPMAEIGALAAGAWLYLGNDTGMTHLAAASGARTIMIFGPSDPARYAPFVAPGQALALWQPTPLPAGGVAQGTPAAWDWARAGITPAEALRQIQVWLAAADHFPAGR